MSEPRGARKPRYQDMLLTNAAGNGGRVKVSARSHFRRSADALVRLGLLTFVYSDGFLAYFDITDAGRAKLPPAFAEQVDQPMTEQTEAEHPASCALSCCQRTAEEWQRIRREVARDLAGHDGKPPVPALTAAEVIVIIGQRRGSNTRYDNSPEAAAERNVPHDPRPLCREFVAQPDPAEFWCRTCRWNRPMHDDEAHREAIAAVLRKRGTRGTSEQRMGEINR